MGSESKQFIEQARELTARARAMCDHRNHRHDWDSDGPGYTCSDCGEHGYGQCGFCLIERTAVEYATTRPSYNLDDLQSLASTYINQLHSAESKIAVKMMMDAWWKWLGKREKESNDAKV